MDKKNVTAERKWRSHWEIVIGVVTLLGLIVAANGFEESRLGTQRSAAEDSYYQLVSNLGSENVVVRVGAIGQIGGVLIREVPVEGQPKLWEGLLYVLGLHEHETSKPYHEDVLRVISALVLAPKSDSEASRFETEALLEMLCRIGPEGWYKAESRVRAPVREDCLSWIWRDAPESRRVDLPSYRLFRLSDIRYAMFNRYNLKGANFSNAFVERSSFAESNLEGAQFGGADLRGVTFSNADLRRVSFNGAVLEDVEFAGADLAGTDFTGARLIRVSFALARNRRLALGLKKER